MMDWLQFPKFIKRELEKPKVWVFLLAALCLFLFLDRKVKHEIATERKELYYHQISFFEKQKKAEISLIMKQQKAKEEIYKEKIKFYKEQSELLRLGGLYEATINVKQTKE